MKDRYFTKIINTVYKIISNGIARTANYTPYVFYMNLDADKNKKNNIYFSHK